MSDYTAQLAARIVKARLDAGMNPPEVARRTGVARSALWNWEKGRRSITAEHLLALAATLDVDPLWLLTGELGVSRVSQRRINGAVKALLAAANILDDVMEGKL